MGKVKLIRKFFRRMKMGDEEFKERMGIAYHEAGHSVIGYLYNHTSNYIDINLNIRNQIYPHVDKDFGLDEQVIKEISKSDINALRQRQQSELIDVAEDIVLDYLQEHLQRFGFSTKNTHHHLKQLINTIEKK